MNNKLIEMQEMLMRQMKRLDDDKINEKQWVYKQRLIYEQYHNVKLPKDYIVVFLDNDKTNYDIDNLMAVPIKVALRTAGQDMFFKDKELTKTALEISAVRLKIMEVEND